MMEHLNEEKTNKLNEDKANEYIKKMDDYAQKAISYYRKKFGGSYGVGELIKKKMTWRHI